MTLWCGRKFQGGRNSGRAVARIRRGACAPRSLSACTRAVEPLQILKDKNDRLDASAGQPPFDHRRQLFAGNLFRRKVRQALKLDRDGYQRRQQGGMLCCVEFGVGENRFEPSNGGQISRLPSLPAVLVEATRRAAVPTNSAASASGTHAGASRPDDLNAAGDVIGQMCGERSGEQHQHAVPNSLFCHDPGEQDQESSCSDDGDHDAEAKHRAGRRRDVVEPLDVLCYFHALERRKRQGEDSRRAPQAFRMVLADGHPASERGNGEAGIRRGQARKAWAARQRRKSIGPRRAQEPPALQGLGVEAGKPKAKPEPVDRQAANGDCPTSRVAKQRACRAQRAAIVQGPRGLSLAHSQVARLLDQAMRIAETVSLGRPLIRSAFRRSLQAASLELRRRIGRRGPRKIRLPSQVSGAAMQG